MENNIELGSEFNLDVNDLFVKNNNVFTFFEEKEVIWLDSGRNAIRVIPYNHGKVLLPEFICESVISCFDENTIEFYSVSQTFDIDVGDIKKKLTNDVSILYIAHYFGYLQNSEQLSELVKYAHEKNVIVIEDITQSMFSKHDYMGDYVVGSVRKWIPVPHGGILIKNSIKAITPSIKFSKSVNNTKVNGMILKSLFLRQGFDVNTQYRNIFLECEKEIDESCDIYEMSDFAKYIASCVDVGEMIKRRRENYLYVEDKISSKITYQIRTLKDEECPLVLPLRVKNRDEFRKYLVDNRIYCAVHWPFDGVKQEQRISAIQNSEQLISIPIDQRYSKNELDYMIKVILKFGGDLLF